VILKKYRLIILITLFFYGHLSALQQDAGDRFCEPSAIFPEMFFLEQVNCFSYTLANEAGLNNRSLTKYLDRFNGSSHQKSYRYYYYLRENSFLAAIITLIDMVNTDSLPVSITDPFKEFNNTLLQGIKFANSENPRRTLQPFEQKAEPKTIDVLDREFFSLLSYVASYVSEQSSQNRDSTIVFRTASILLSNIASGVDWEGDRFIHERFNNLVKIKNEELLESYISMFFFYTRGDDFNIPSFSKYIRLKEAGVVSNMRSLRTSLGESSSVRKIIAGFFIDNLQKMPRIIVTDNLPLKPDKDKIEMCNYLEERKEWFASVSYLNEDTMFFNEAVKIVEQCPGSLSFPFVIEADKIYVDKDSLWITDIALTIRYLMVEDISMKDGDAVLRGAVRASLEKAAARESSSLDEQFLLYSLKIGKSAQILRSFFAKYLLSNYQKK